MKEKFVTLYERNFTLYWRNGVKSWVIGTSIGSVLSSFTHDANRVLDFYVDGDNDEYTWNAEKHSWEVTKYL